MSNRFFSTPGPMPRDVAEEILSLCHAAQIDALALLRRNVDADRGGACPLPRLLDPAGADPGNELRKDIP